MPVRDPPPSWSSLSPSEASLAAAEDPVVILPVASTEQHGPHLPPTTDLDICVGLVEEAFQHVPEDAAVWVLPPLTIGASLEHAHLPGTRSVSTEHLMRQIQDVGVDLSRAGVRRLVLFNSHGGNRSALDAAALWLRAERRMLVVKANYFRFARPPDVELPESEWKHGLHGGALESAMMLHLKPESVRVQAFRDFTSLGVELEARLRRLSPEGEASFAWLADDLNPEGVVGDARLANPDLGLRLVAHYGRALADVILDARDFPLERLQPPPTLG